MKKSAAIFLAVGLSLSALAGTAQAAGGHNGGHFGGSAGHFSGGHFGGRGGGHFGGHFGHHGGYGRGYGYGALGFGLGLGLGALYYDGDYAAYDGYGPVPHDYNDNYPDDSVPPQDAVEQGAPPNEPGYWYRCADPAGYYPYVGICPTPWQAVPAVPPPPSDRGN